MTEEMIVANDIPVVGGSAMTLDSVSVLLSSSAPDPAPIFSRASSPCFNLLFVASHSGDSGSVVKH